MKLKEYANYIAELAEKYPNAKVVSAIDEEGNGFNEVVYSPSAGTFKDGEFSEGGKVNAVCIN